MTLLWLCAVKRRWAIRCTRMQLRQTTLMNKWHRSIVLSPIHNLFKIDFKILLRLKSYLTLIKIDIKMIKLFLFCSIFSIQAKLCGIIIKIRSKEWRLEKANSLRDLRWLLSQKIILNKQFFNFRHSYKIGK